MILIDKIAYTSDIRSKSPYLKALLAVGSLFVCVIFRLVIISVIILFVMGYLAVKYSRVSFYKYLNLMFVPFVFLLLGSIAILFDFSQVPLDFINIHIGDFYISASKESLMYTAELIIVALASVSCLYFLSLTTPIQDLIIVMKSIKIPWLIIEITMLMYRFIFVLADMTAAIMLSQDCRLGNTSLKRKINSMGMMLSVVLIRALNKSNKLYDSMESRCYDGKIQVLWECEKASSKEKMAISLFLSALIVLSVIIKLNKGV